MATPTSLPASFSAGNVLTASQMDNLRGAFRVLQVVSGTTATQTTNSSNTYADTNLTATITPAATSNKVLVLVSQAGCFKDTGNTWLALRLMRGATQLIEFEGYGGYNAGTTDNAFGSCSCVYLDSPSTTSATTYKTQLKSVQNIAKVGVQASATSTIILMEISA